MSIQNLMAELDLRKFGWSRVGKNGRSAFFPMTAKWDSGWESRCAEMHRNQIPICLQAKPESNDLADRIRTTVRSD